MIPTLLVAWFAASLPVAMVVGRLLREQSLLTDSIAAEHSEAA